MADPASAAVSQTTTRCTDAAVQKRRRMPSVTTVPPCNVRAGQSTIRRCYSRARVGFRVSGQNWRWCTHANATAPATVSASAPTVLDWFAEVAVVADTALVTTAGEEAEAEAVTPAEIPLAAVAPI
jgi:hypothetical protein